MLLLREAGHDSCSSSVLHEHSCSMYRQLLYRLAHACPTDSDLPNAASLSKKTQATVNDKPSTRGACWSARTMWGVSTWSNGCFRLQQIATKECLRKLLQVKSQVHHAKRPGIASSTKARNEPCNSILPDDLVCDGAPLCTVGACICRPSEHEHTQAPATQRNTLEMGTCANHLLSTLLSYRDAWVLCIDKDTDTNHFTSHDWPCMLVGNKWQRSKSRVP